MTAGQPCMKQPPMGMPSLLTSCLHQELRSALCTCLPILQTSPLFGSRANRHLVHSAASSSAAILVTVLLAAASVLTCFLWTAICTGSSPLHELCIVLSRIMSRGSAYCFWVGALVSLTLNCLPVFLTSSCGVTGGLEDIQRVYSTAQCCQLWSCSCGEAVAASRRQHQPVCPHRSQCSVQRCNCWSVHQCCSPLQIVLCTASVLIHQQDITLHHRVWLKHA